MKAFKTILFLCVVLCFATSCKKDPDMTLVQKTVLENNTLRQIHVDDAWEVTVVYDSLNSFVELEYSAYLEDYVSVRETNDWLAISFNKQVYKQLGSVFKATVHTKEKENLSISAENASVINMEGHFELEEGIDIDLHTSSVCRGFEVTAPSCSILVAEDSQLFGVQYIGTDCSVLVSKNSSCKCCFNAEHSFNANVQLSSQLIVFGGLMPSATIEANNAGTINMVQAEIEDLYIHLDGASEATVNVTNTLSGFLLTASTLYYIGNPQLDVDCSDDSQLIPL